MTAMQIAVYANERANSPSVGEVTWPELVDSLTEYRRAACTVATCPGKDCPHKLGQAWSPVIIEGTRADKNVRAMTAAVFDLDHVKDDDDAWLDRLTSDGVAYVLHSSHSHRASDLCLRLVMPLSRPVPASDWRRMWSALIDRYELPVDRVCKDLSRIYFAPSAPSDADVFVLKNVEGKPLDVDEILASAPMTPAPTARTSGAPSAGTIAEGGRNAALASIAGRMRNSGMSVDAIEAALLAENAARCVPPLDDDEVIRIAQSIGRYEPTHDVASDAAFGEMLKRVAARQSDVASTMPVAMPEVSPEQYVRPTIMVRASEVKHVTDQAEHALDTLGGVYVRGRQLVHVVRDRSAGEWLLRPQGMPVIAPLQRHRLAELLGVAAEWRQFDSKGDPRPTMVPQWVVDTLIARDEWRFPPLEGVVDAPTLRPDGTILDVPGYDEATRLIYDPGNVVYPSVPLSPSRAEAAQRFAELLDPFVDFPFVADSDRAAVAAMILSIIGRAAIDGCVPMFSSGAPTPGSGKGLLVDVVSTIATGRPAPKMAPTDDDEETRKRLLAIAMESPPIVLLDNVEGAIGSASLAMALTAGEVRDRLLGKSSIITASLRPVWALTGNNVQLRGDLGRRVVPIGIDPGVEHPEDRSGFRHPDLLAYVRNERARLVTAALTILRAYIAADRPAHGKSAKGSFEAWDRLVRGAVIWSAGIDPLAGVERIRQAGDSDLDNLRALLASLRAMFGDKAVTAAEIVHEATSVTAAIDPRSTDRAVLRDALVPYADKSGRLDSKTLGYSLRKLSGRIADGLALHAGKRGKHGVPWAVRAP